MTKGLIAALPAILILLIVGLLIGISIANGVVPVMIFYLFTQDKLMNIYGGGTKG